jgi:hypothetical protein
MLNFSFKTLILREIWYYAAPAERADALTEKSSGKVLKVVLVRWPSGRRRSPAKGVYPLNGIEGSTPSLTAIIKYKKAQSKDWAFLLPEYLYCCLLNLKGKKIPRKRRINYK